MLWLCGVVVCCGCVLWLCAVSVSLWLCIVVVLVAVFVTNMLIYKEHNVVIYKELV